MNELTLWLLALALVGVVWLARPKAVLLVPVGGEPTPVPVAGVPDAVDWRRNVQGSAVSAARPRENVNIFTSANGVRRVR